MFEVSRPITPYNHPMDEVLELRCAVCRRRFAKLEEAFLAYLPPAAGTRSEARWLHRKCHEAQPPAGEAPVRLRRADHALKSLIESLRRPPITQALRKDWPTAKRPWGNP